MRDYLFILLLLATLLAGQAFAAGSETVLHRPALVRFDLEQIGLPAAETMGMLGTTYLVEIAPEIYFGGAAYGAISGKRGGFFTVGPELAWRRRWSAAWETEAGIYAGGGGGGSATALVGGGLMLRPHVDLLRNFGGYRAGISASSVRFPSGKIFSSQLGLVLSTDTDFTQLAATSLQEPSGGNERGGVGFDRVHAIAGAYRGTLLPAPKGKMTAGMVGFRMEQMLTPDSYWGVEAAGAASGGIAGYAEFLGTVGMEIPVWERLRVGGRVALGMGGGGGVSVGGGVLGKVGAYATATLTRDTHASLEFGYASAPNGQFRARYASADLQLDLDHPYATAGVLEVNGYEWQGGVCHYFNAAHKDGSVSSMDAVVLKVSRYLDDDWYMTGQAHSAIRGNSGGYSAGLFGLGYRSEIIAGSLSGGAEMMLGAAGGGGIDSSGAIVMPDVFLDWRLNQMFAVRLGAGRLKSSGGALNTRMAEMSLRFSYSVARH
jgi:hypothetical protein